MVPGSPGVGRVAFIAGVALFVVSLAASLILGLVGAPFAICEPQLQFSFHSSDPNPTIAALGIAGVLHLVLGTAVGMWVVVQSIVAMAANRGRRLGARGLILALVTPVLSIALYLSIMINGG